MELLLEPNKAKQNYKLTDDSSFSKNRIVNVISKDFNRSVANIIGLISLLDDTSTSDPDFKTIHQYLAVEAHNLDILVKKCL